MEHSLIVSGFGGQGALFAGQILAYAAMDVGLHVTWIPSYGPEMRGGTAHCTVIIADEPIGAPLVRRPMAVIALNNPSLEKYESLVAPGGLLVYNAPLATRAPTRSDIALLAVPGSEIAAELGEPRLLNMVMLGALLAHSEILPLVALDAALAAHLPAHRRALLPLNRDALRRGAEISILATRSAVAPQ